MRLVLVKRLLLGAPMPLAQARHERLNKTVALAVFASDPLSSVAYATEEILLVLMLGGTAALSYSLPVAVGIAALLAVVVVSYRQTVAAYPQGGGAYLVAKDNIGQYPALIAAAALLVDYVLTVSVSVVAGIAALTSAVAWLHPYRIVLSVLAVIGIALGNLRGVRESGRLFAAPTYFFVASILSTVSYGLVGAIFDWLPAAPYEPHPPGLEGLGLFLLLRSYAAGCTALTGVEAVSNGVQALKPPEGRNAQAVMTALGIISIVMFLGITYLAYDFGIIPGGDETVVSKIAQRGRGAGDRRRAVDAHGDEVRRGRLDRRGRDSGAGGDVRRHAPSLRGGRARALARGPRGAAEVPAHRPGVDRRRPSRRRPGCAVRPDARADRGGARRVRRDGPDAHGPSRGQVGQVGARRAAGRPDLALPLAAAAPPGLSRPAPLAR